MKTIKKKMSDYLTHCLDGEGFISIKAMEKITKEKINRLEYIYKEKTTTFTHKNNAKPIKVTKWVKNIFHEHDR